MCDNRKTWVQPLGTNDKVEIETQGMHQALLDFEEQVGITRKAAGKLLLWASRDGASFTAMW